MKSKENRAAVCQAGIERPEPLHPRRVRELLHSMREHPRTDVVRRVEFLLASERIAHDNPRVARPDGKR
jgi:hypothetical protein